MCTWRIVSKGCLCSVVLCTTNCGVLIVQGALFPSLFRHQFPPTPTRQGSQSGIPAWQRVQLPPASPGGLKTPQHNGPTANGNSESTSPTSAANGGSPAASAKDLAVASQLPLEQRVEMDPTSASEEQWHDTED